MLNLILTGKRGADFDRVALPYIKKALCLEDGEDGCSCNSCSVSFSSHPDLLIKDANEYSVEDVDEVLSFIHQPTMLSDRRVCYFKSFHLLSVIAQNKLLKDLESNEHFCFVGTSDIYSNGVLETIQSRCAVRRMPEVSYDMFLKYFTGDNSDAVYYYYMSGGCHLLCGEMEKQLPVYKGVVDAVRRLDKAMFLSSVHVATEKDPLNYYEDHKGYVSTNLYPCIVKVALDEVERCIATGNSSASLLAAYLDVAECAEKEWKKAVSDPLYAKSDFFLSMAIISLAMNKKERV